MPLHPPASLLRYQDGDTPLHHVDPRLKLLSLSLLVVATFATSRLTVLLGMTLLLVLTAVLGGYPLRHLVGLVARLRIPVLATLLIHLLFTPGRTMAGVAWLSLDGLWLGLHVSLQLMLALGWSALLTRTSPPAHLAQALERLAAPLAKLGVPVRRVTQSLGLVLYFLERLSSRESLAPSQQVAATPASGSWTERLERYAGQLGERLRLLLAHADEVAVRLARGEGVTALESLPVAPWGFGTSDAQLVVVVCVTCWLAWGAG